MFKGAYARGAEITGKQVDACRHTFDAKLTFFGLEVLSLCQHSGVFTMTICIHGAENIQMELGICGL